MPRLFPKRAPATQYTIGLCYGNSRQLGRCTMPKYVLAVPIKLSSGAVVYVTEFDLDAYHERGIRPMVRLPGSTGRAGLYELSRWLDMRGREQELSMPVFAVFDTSVADTVRALLHGEDVGVRLPADPPAEPLRLEISLSDTLEREFVLAAFSGLNIILGPPGSGKTFVLAAICHMLDIVPTSFSESGRDGRVGYPAGFLSFLYSFIDFVNSAGDSLRWATRADAAVLMEKGWSAKFFEFMVALAQALERLKKVGFASLNPMGAEAVGTIFAGVASSVWETGGKDVPKPTSDENGNVFIHVTYTTRRVASRPVLSGIVNVTPADIEYGKLHGIIADEDLEALELSVVEQDEEEPTGPIGAPLAETRSNTTASALGGKR